MTPTEEKVWEAIKKLPDATQSGAFRRCNLNVDVPERSVKQALRSLSESGYLECDYRKGRMGNTYTVAHEPPSTTCGISLCPLPINPASEIQTIDNFEDSSGNQLGNGHLPEIAHSSDSAPVSFMISAEVRRKLCEYGESEDEIDQMKPSEAQALLEYFGANLPRDAPKATIPFD